MHCIVVDKKENFCFFRFPVFLEPVSAGVDRCRSVSDSYVVVVGPADGLMLQRLSVLLVRVGSVDVAGVVGVVAVVGVVNVVGVVGTVGVVIADDPVNRYSVDVVSVVSTVGLVGIVTAVAPVAPANFSML